MSTDTYKRDQICYLNEQNRKGTAARLIRSGYIILSRAPIISHLKNNAPLDFFIWYSSNDYIIELTRIQICFEHYMEAQLLLNGFVVHEPSKGKRSLFNSLKDSTTTLVPIAELMNNVHFVYDPIKHYNHIPELSDHTLPFGQMIKLTAIHNIPQNVVAVLEKCNDLRNTLHFTEAEPQGFDASILKDVLVFADTVILPTLNNLADDLQIPNLKL